MEPPAWELGDSKHQQMSAAQKSLVNDKNSYGKPLPLPRCPSTSSIDLMVFWLFILIPFLVCPSSITTFRGLGGAFSGAERLSGPALLWLRAPIDSDVGLLSGLFSTSKIRISRSLFFYSVWVIKAVSLTLNLRLSWPSPSFLYRAVLGEELGDSGSNEDMLSEFWWECYCIWWWIYSYKSSDVGKTN